MGRQALPLIFNVNDLPLKWERGEGGRKGERESVPQKSYMIELEADGGLRRKQFLFRLTKQAWAVSSVSTFPSHSFPFSSPPSSFLFSLPSFLPSMVRLKFSFYLKRQQRI